MKNRVINQGYWTDPEYLTWTHEQKYFYLYLITCSHTNLIGIAPLIPEHFALEAKLPLEQVKELLLFLQDKKKIYLSEHYLFVFALFKYQSFGGKTINTAVKNLLKEVRDPEILHIFKTLYPQYSEDIPDIDNICPIDALSIPHTYPIDNRDRDIGQGHRTGTRDIGHGHKTGTCQSSSKNRSQPARSNGQHPTPYKEIVDLFNGICKSLPKVTNPDTWKNPSRKNRIRALWKQEPKLSTWQELFEKVEESDFLTGRSGKWAGANFDWILKPNNLQKIIEGNYDNRKDFQERKSLEVVNRWVEKE